MEAFFSSALSIIGALLILSVLVMVHELGHFGAGKLLGFSIQEFAIGMGPKIFSRERNGTQFSVRALPIGGSCRFYGEDEAPVDAVSFNAQKPWKRFIVLFSGAFMNIIFAYLFAVVTLLAYGNLMPAVTSFYGDNKPAVVAGMQPGDILLEVDGKRIEYVNDASAKIREAQGPDIVVTVERAGEKIDILIQDVYDAAEGRNLLGINIEPVRKSFGFFEAIGESFSYCASIVGEMVRFLGSIFTTGVQQGEVMGPVGTIGLISTMVRTGFEVVLRLAVLLSINLAVINLLPLPALDGGRIVFVLVEAIRRKPIAPEKEGMVHFVGIILLFALIALLTIGDIRSLLGG